MEALQIKLSSINAKASSMSGGNQQKVVVGNWLNNDPEIMIYDEPTRGIDVNAKQQIFEIMWNQAKAGHSSIFVSTELEELPGLQLQILRNQARYVKKGGILMYATCTILRRENEDVVAAFLEGNKDFYRESLELPDEIGNREDGMLTLIPGDYDTDGFFICRLRRNP